MTMLMLCACTARYADPESMGDDKIIVSIPGNGERLESVHTPDGYEWLLTEDGLFVHDGSNYLHFVNTSDPASISSNVVNGMMVDLSGRIWVATQRGVDRYDEESGVFFHYVIDDVNHYMRDVAMASDGSVYAISRHYLFKLDEAEGVFRKFSPLKISRSNIQMDANVDGAVWVNYHNEVVRIPVDDRCEPCSIAAREEIDGFCADRSGRLYLCDGGHLRIVSPDSPVEEEIPAGLAHLSETSVVRSVRSIDGMHVHLETDHGAFDYDSSLGILSSPDDDESLKTLYMPLLHVIERTGARSTAQSGNNVWILSSPTTLERFGILENRVIGHYDIPEVTGSRLPCTDIKCSRDGKVVLYGGGIVHVLYANENGALVPEHSYPLPQNPRAAVAVADDGSLWAAGTGTILYCAEPGGSFQAVQTSLPDISVDCWRAITLRDGTIVFGFSDLGPVLLDPRTRQIRTAVIPEEVKQMFVMDLFEDSRGYICVSTSDNGLLVLDRQTGVLDRPEALSGEEVISVTEGAGGVMYINTMKGAYLCRNHEYSRLWNDVDEFPKQKTLFRTPDGQVFLMVGGKFVSLSSISTEGGTRFRYPLSVVLASSKRVIGYTNTTFGGSADIRLSRLPNDLSLYMSCLDFSHRRVMSYSYRIGRRGDWQSVVGTSVVPLYNIGYGRSRIDVKAMDMSTMSESDVLSIDVTVRRPFFHYLLALLFISVVAVSYILYRLRNKGVREAEMIKAEKEMQERVNQGNIDFFGNISHEFRTPLTLIHGAVDMLREDGKMEGDQARLLDVVNSNTLRMLKLVSQMLDFNKLDHDTLILSVARTDIRELTAGVVDMFAAGARKKSLDLSYVCEAETLEGWVDTDKIEKIMYNLLSNALKYTPPAGSVTVSVAQDGGDMVLKVQDTGIGIPEDKLEAIFERFTRTDSGREISSGSGIGLNYTRSLVNLHHGTVVAANATPCGALFTVRIPIGAEAYSENEKQAAVHDTFVQIDDKSSMSEYLEPQTASSSEKTKPTMLIIDDDYEMVHFLKMLMEKDFDVDFRYDAVSGYAQMEKSSPDIVICDVMMVEMDGFTFCRMAKENKSTSHIPIVLLTAKSTVRDQIDGYSAGADAYVVKPFDNEYLKTLVESVLANRKRLQSLLQKSTTLPSSKISGTSQNDKELLEKLYALMEESLSAQELDVDTISAKLGYSRTKLFYKVKALTGQTPNEFFTVYRLNRSLELLKTGKYKIAAVASMVGFNSASHFSSLFKKHFNVLPSQVKDL